MKHRRVPAIALALSTAWIAAGWPGTAFAQGGTAAPERPSASGDPSAASNRRDEGPIVRELRERPAPAETQSTPGVVVEKPASEPSSRPPSGPPAAGQPTVVQPDAQAQSPVDPRRSAEAAPPTKVTALRFEGSNTVGEQLAPSLVRAWAAKLGYTAIKTIGSVRPEESEVVAEAAERGDSLHATIHAHGTGTGLDPLAAGRADIWMASRQANASEVAKAEGAGLGKMLEATNEHTIALDGLLIVVHPENPVKRLTIAELADVFSGKTTRWSDVGGRDAPIVVYSRDTRSGTFDTFKTLVLRGKSLIASAKLYEASEELSDEVASDPNGIGFIGLAYARSAKPLSVATECGLSIAPSAFSIKTGEYPLARRLYMYTPDKVGAQAKGFLEFAQSLDAQDVVAKAGFVDFRPAVADRRYTGERLDTASNSRDGGQVSIRDTDVGHLEDATGGAVRLAVTFRFIAGSDHLDSLARADIERLRDILKAPTFIDAKVILIGFTQSLGDYQSNRDISRRRAAAVKAELEAKGVEVASAVGVGPAAPIACNTDDTTRALNQRVEVWIRLKAAR